MNTFTPTLGDTGEEQETIEVLPLEEPLSVPEVAPEKTETPERVPAGV
jgi:hypothetical protein